MYLLKVVQRVNYSEAFEWAQYYFLQAVVFIWLLQLPLLHHGICCGIARYFYNKKLLALIASAGEF
jgi:hypothetical protein